VRAGSLNILIVTPAPPGSRTGNRVTALRWARLLRELGHRVVVTNRWQGGRRCDVFIALHARKSFAALRTFAAAHPSTPRVLALTGTDVYHDIHHDIEARRALGLATRLVVLQPMAMLELPAALRARTRVIYQSAPRAAPAGRKPRRWFQVCVLGHLRDVKDPFRTAAASARLPADSRIRVRHVGAALDRGMRVQARRWMQRSPRYRWIGERSRAQALALLRRSHLLVLSSKAEGGANAISEALAADVPVLASRIAGSVGLLGESYPGYFAVGATQELAELLSRCERRRDFSARLVRACRRRRRLVEPAREKEAWRRLLAELALT
jgi:putative glycosyltransferase (TIGR04348 family)